MLFDDCVLQKQKSGRNAPTEIKFLLLQISPEFWSVRIIFSQTFQSVYCRN